MDKLQYIFMCQQDLQKRLLDVKLPNDRPDLISHYSLGLVSEIGEVLQADKRWKNLTGGDNKTHNHKEVREELSDCLLYFINLVMACNIGVDEFFDSFIATQNKVRKRNGFPEVRYSNE